MIALAVDGEVNELSLSRLRNAKSAANLSHEQIGDFVMSRHWLAPRHTGFQ
jgi:hypothetical protein